MKLARAIAELVGLWIIVALALFAAACLMSTVDLMGDLGRATQHYSRGET
jgi:hypothetical protein